jgi:hypothetical protein
MNNNETHSADHFHRKLVGKIMWDKVGMAREC